MQSNSPRPSRPVPTNRRHLPAKVTDHQAAPDAESAPELEPASRRADEGGQSDRIIEELSYPGSQDRMQGADDRSPDGPLGGRPPGHPEALERADGRLVLPD